MERAFGRIAGMKVPPKKSNRGGARPVLNAFGDRRVVRNAAMTGTQQAKRMLGGLA